MAAGDTILTSTPRSHACAVAKVRCKGDVSGFAVLDIGEIRYEDSDLFVAASESSPYGMILLTVEREHRHPHSPCSGGCFRAPVRPGRGR
jgi:hypothetical protein